MSPTFAILLLSLGISLTVTPLVRDAALKRGKLDQAHSSRKVHARAVPRLGGVGIVAGIYLAIGAGALLIPAVRHTLSMDFARVAWLGVAGGLIALLGLYDDLRGADARTKFTVQFVVALLLYRAGYRIDVIENPLGASLALHSLSLPVTVLWIAGVSNAVNLVDGLDGLAGGLSLAGSIVLFAIGVHAGDMQAMIVSVALAGAIVGFLTYNVNPASVFMGDTGSLFLGTVLAALTLRPHGAHGGAVPLFAMAMALGVPLADTAFAIVRRWLRGAPLFAADRDHLHHRLLGLGLSHRQAVLVLWVAAAILSGAAIQLACGSRLNGLVLLGVVTGGTLGLVRVGMLRWPSSFLRVRRQLNRARLEAVRRCSEQLREAADIEEVRGALESAAGVLGARTILLRLTGDDTPPVVIAASESKSRFVLDQSNPTRGYMKVVWREALEVDRDTEIAMELLAHGVASAVDRIERVGASASWLGAVVETVFGRERPAA